MSATPKLCENPCETCQKEGLPILLTRYAVLPEDSKAPRLSGQLKCEDVPLKGGKTHYGLRLLRSGYVYVYDEARKHMDEYFVTSDGFLTKMPLRNIMLKNALHKPATEFACARSGKRPLAGVITISNPKCATTVWIGFSDAAWTNLTYFQHLNDAGLRTKHMRDIKIKGGKVSPQPHVAPLEEVEKVVPEFNSGTASASFKSWNPFPYNNRAHEITDFKAAVKNLRPEGGAAVVALEDPVGVATELAALMEHYLALFMKDDKCKRELFLSDTIAQLELAIKSQARTEKEKAAEEAAANKLARRDAIGLMLPGTMGAFSRKGVEVDDIIEPVTRAEATQAGEQAWKKYKDKYNYQKVENWRQQFERDLKSFDAVNIVPLAEAHKAWMISKPMCHSFECNFDDKNAESGIVYAKTLQLCIAGTQDKKVCFDLYHDWLNGSITDKNNLILRALVLNLEKTAKEIQSAVKVNLDWRGFPIDGLVDGFTKTTEKVMAGTPDALGKFVAMLLGPMAKALDNAVDGKVRSFLVALNLHTGVPFHVRTVTGTQAEFIASRVHQMISLNQGTYLNAKQRHRAVKSAWRQAQKDGIDLKTTQTKAFLVLGDAKTPTALPSNVSAKKVGIWAASNAITPQELENLNLARWQQTVRNPVAKGIKGSLPYIGGLICAIVQYNVIQKLGEDEIKAMKHEATEAKQRHRAGQMLLGATIAGIVEMGIKQVANYVPRMGQGVVDIVGIFAKFSRVGLGIFGAMIMVWWDFKQAVDNFREGNIGLAVAYLGSATLGAASFYYLGGYSMAAGSTGIGIVLVILLIGVVLLIETYKDNKVQDWLERTLWGNKKEYNDLEEEQRELSKATAG